MVDLFSEKEKIDKGSVSLVYSLNKGFRVGMINLFMDALENGFFISPPSVIYKVITRQKRIVRSIDVNDENKTNKWINDYLINAFWVDVLDVVQILHTLIDDKNFPEFKKIYLKEVNKFFKAEWLGFYIDENGEIEKVVYDYTSSDSSSTIETVLEKEGLQGPLIDYKKAKAHLNNRPDPDTENAVKDSIGALEGVARLILNEPTKTLSDLLPVLKEKNIFPTPLDQLVSKLYAYRGNQDGVGHGKTSSERIPFFIAHTIVQISGNLINLLINWGKEEKKD
ncbi:hypothetical protein KJ705_01160 [Patescibacteria group bacterium]|nr:hypothetical protein [Patescibacteria group bacterium]